MSNLLWEVTLVVFYFGGVCACAMLYYGIPPGPERWLQKFAIALGAASMVVFSIYHALKLGGSNPHWSMKLGGYGLSHAAFMLMIFRLWILQQERRCLKKSYKPSHN